jgi:hypothetical protein
VLFCRNRKLASLIQIICPDNSFIAGPAKTSTKLMPPDSEDVIEVKRLVTCSGCRLVVVVSLAGITMTVVVVLEISV